MTDPAPDDRGDLPPVVVATDPALLRAVHDGAVEVYADLQQPEVVRGPTSLPAAAVPTRVLGLPVHVDASLDEDEIEIRRPDGSVVARARLRTHAEVRDTSSALERIRSLPGEAGRIWRHFETAVDGMAPDEPLEGLVVCDSEHPRAYTLGGPNVRCMRPLGHRPPHAHIDLQSLAAMPMRVWRGVTER